MKRIYRTNLIGIPKLAETISKQLTGGEIFGLVGQLGSGKTTFAQALAKHLKVKGLVTSPTFIIMNRHKGWLPRTKKPIFFHHLDLYRAKSYKEFTALGLEEVFNQTNSVTAIEWADSIKQYLPKHTCWIYFS